MSLNFEFSFSEIETQFKIALDRGYAIMTCADYVKRKAALPSLTIVNRIDIDFSVKKAERLCKIFDRLNIKGSFFIRLHAPEYNPFSFENYRILKTIRDSGHEIGYHSEVIDQADIWNEDASDCLRRDIDVINRMLGIEIQGVASHGGRTGLNNLDFWKERSASQFGLKYEAYDQAANFNLFGTSLYISDSEWTRWKCYQDGSLLQGDHRSLAEHVEGLPPLIYLLIHSDTYFDRHCYE